MVVPLCIYGFGSGGSVVGSVLFSVRFFFFLLPLLLPLEGVGEQICRTMFG